MTNPHKTEPVKAWVVVDGKWAVSEPYTDYYEARANCDELNRKEITSRFYQVVRVPVTITKGQTDE